MESGQEPREGVPGEELADDAEEPSSGSAVFRREGLGDNGRGLEQDREPALGDGGDSIAQTLRNVAATLEADEDDAPAADGLQDGLFPRQPRTLAEVGLSKAFLTDLTLKIMHYSGTPSSAQLMRRLGLNQGMVQQILAAIQEERLCEVMSQSDLFTGNYRYRLSERGTARASEALERTRYAGPVPVTAEQYAEVMRAQQARRETVAPGRIKAILSESVLAPEVADAVARALYSGQTTMLYGPSGNGKTSILERYAHSLEGGVLVPYAIYAYGQVIRVFDPSIHEALEEVDDNNSMKDEAKLDRRWVLVRRPAVLLGSGVGAGALGLASEPPGG